MTLNTTAFDEDDNDDNISNFSTTVVDPNDSNTKKNSSATELLHKEMASMWQFRIDTDPELAAMIGCLSQRSCVSTQHALDPRSIQSFQYRNQYIQQALQRIRTSIHRDDLTTKEDQLSYDLFVQQLSDYIEYSPKHMSFLNCVNRLEGPQNDIPLYATYLPLQSHEQRLFYLQFLLAVPQQIREDIELLKIGLECKRTPPQISLDGVVPQIRTMVTNGLMELKNPIMDKKDLFQSNLYEQCMEQISGPVSDAYTELANYLEIEYIPNIRIEISAVKGYPNGASYYADCLKFHTTTNMTTEEIHQLGLDEIQRVQQQMMSIAEQEGYKDRLQEYLQYLRTAPEYTPSSADALVTHYRDITGRIAPALLNLFHSTTLPRMPFAITETPAAHATTAPAAYYLAGSFDPTSPRCGIFYVNTSELSTRRTYECEALALHESIPGHHTQGSIQGENTNLPSFRRYQEDRRYFEAPSRFPFYTAYIEGWGLHSETLGKELGLYKHNSDVMGQLSMEALRCCRLIVDTGMHAMGWSKDQALQYMIQNTAMGIHDAETEVARYITWPGQACAYKVGERMLHKLRTKAEDTLKDKFDPRAYYDVVLQCGPVPLDILEKLVDEYIANFLS